VEDEEGSDAAVRLLEDQYWWGCCLIKLALVQAACLHCDHAFLVCNTNYQSELGLCRRIVERVDKEEVVVDYANDIDTQM
jgi:hypothetical protein